MTSGKQKELRIGIGCKLKYIAGAVGYSTRPVAINLELPSPYLVTSPNSLIPLHNVISKFMDRDHDCCHQ